MEENILLIMRFYLIVIVFLCVNNFIIAKKNKIVRRPPQFVMLSFDGSKSVKFWKQTREFANNEGIKFTYFISGPMFLTYPDRKLYKSPRFPRGESNIDFGGTKKAIRERLKEVILAIKEGHEIGSHANGHYPGAEKWTYKEWLSEFGQFNQLIKGSCERYGVDSKQAKFIQNYLDNELKGFRAPLLAYNKAMLRVMKKKGFTYDASKLENKDYWPQKIGGLWNFPIVKLTLAHSGKGTLSMDYEHYKIQSGAKNIGYYSKKFENEVVETYMNYFRNNYYGNRAPLHIGHHFSQWNKGVYWGAMKKFAQKICHMPEVRCTTYKKLVEFLELTPASFLKAYQTKSFEISSYKLTAKN